MIRKTIITIVCLIIGCQHQPAIAESAKAQQFRRDVRASLARGRAEFEGKYEVMAMNEEERQSYREINSTMNDEQREEHRQVLQKNVILLQDDVIKWRALAHYYVDKAGAAEVYAERLAKELEYFAEANQYTDSEPARSAKRAIQEWRSYRESCNTPKEEDVQP